MADDEDDNDTYEAWVWHDLRPEPGEEAAAYLGMLAYPQDAHQHTISRYWMLDPDHEDVVRTTQGLSELGYTVRRLSEVAPLCSCLTHRPIAGVEDMIIVGIELDDLEDALQDITRAEALLDVKLTDGGWPEALLLRFTGPYVMPGYNLGAFADRIAERAAAAAARADDDGEDDHVGQTSWSKPAPVKQPKKRKPRKLRN